MLASMIGMASAQTGVGIYFVQLSRSAQDCVSLRADNATSPADSILGWSWTPLPLLMLFTAAFNIGAGSLTWLIAAEILPVRSRPWTLSLASLASNLSWFLVTKTFRTFQINYGFYSPFFLYGSASLVGFVFIFLFLPETRDRNCQTIENEFQHLHQIKPGVFCENEELK